MRVLAVTHGPAVQPELFGDVVVEEGHELSNWDIRTQGPPPGGFDAVFVFGGDQNVGEEVAASLAARRVRGAATNRRRRDTAVHGLPRRTDARARVRRRGLVDRRAARGVLRDDAHGRRRRRPGARRAAAQLRGAERERLRVHVARAGASCSQKAPSPQAFRIGPRAWAVQFHPEVRRDQVLGWFREEPVLPRPLVELERELDEKLPAWQELGRRLARAFLRAAERSSPVSIGRSSRRAHSCHEPT